MEQLAARRAHNSEVAGSNPAPATSNEFERKFLIRSQAAAGDCAVLIHSHLLQRRIWLSISGSVNAGAKVSDICADNKSVEKALTVATVHGEPLEPFNMRPKMKHFKDSKTILIYQSSLPKTCAFLRFNYGRDRIWRFVENWKCNFSLNRQMKRKLQWNVITPFFRSTRCNTSTEFGLGNHYFLWYAV